MFGLRLDYELVSCVVTIVELSTQGPQVTNFSTTPTKYLLLTLTPSPRANRNGYRLVKPHPATSPVTCRPPPCFYIGVSLPEGNFLYRSTMHIKTQVSNSSDCGYNRIPPLRHRVLAVRFILGVTASAAEVVKPLFVSFTVGDGHDGRYADRRYLFRHTASDQLSQTGRFHLEIPRNSSYVPRVCLLVHHWALSKWDPVCFP